MDLIVAVDRLWGIGKDGDLLEKIPEDMRFFRKTTTGGTIIMGRKTLESFPGGKPLPNRKNIVISRDPNYSVEGVTVLHSIQAVLDYVRSACDNEKIFVVGGGSIYEALLDYCDTAYVTYIDKWHNADTFFPSLDEKSSWKLVTESGIKEHEGVKFSFRTYIHK